MSDYPWPQLIRDADGLHLVYGEWVFSRLKLDDWRPHKITRYANMGASRADYFFAFGFRAVRFRRLPEEQH